MFALLTAALLVFSPTAREEATPKSLKERLESLAKDHKGKVAISIRHLVTGEAYTLNGDEPMPTASLIKFPIMVEVYFQVAEGKVKLADHVTLRKEDMVPGSGILTYHFSDGANFPLRDAVRLMIVFSDNTATNLVLDRIGIDATNQRMAKLGLLNTRINAKVFKGSTTSIAPKRTKKYGLGSTTASEMVALLGMMYEGKLVSKEACKDMIDTMKKCEDKDKLKRFLPEKTEVAHKTGSVSDIKTDAGIIYTPGGPVAVCVLTWGNADQRYHPDNAGSIFIGRVGRTVYDYFGTQAAATKGNTNGQRDR
jgi:beta-lactamase class A